MDARNKRDDTHDRSVRARFARGSQNLDARLARWLLIAVAVAGTLAAVWIASSAVTASGAEVIAVPAVDTTFSELADADLPDGVTLRFERLTGPLVLHIEDVALGSRLLADAAQLLWLAMWVGAATALAGIVGEIVAGRPFTVKVSRRITVLIVIAAIGSFVPYAVDNLASRVLMASAGMAPPGPDSVFGMLILEINPASLLAVLVLASLDQAVRHGRRLTDDVEGLV